MNWVMALCLGILGGAAVMYAVLRTVMEKRLRKADKEAKALLAHTQKLERVRSVFVANVTHELKTPLTSIKGYLELLKDGPRDEQTRRSFYDIIEIDAERLHTLINDILQLSEIEHEQDDPRQTVCDVHAMCREVVDSLRPMAEKINVALDMSVPEDLYFKGNPSWLKQLITNLTDNAIKYNVIDGQVMLRAWHEHNCTMISVSDTGIGIPEEHIAHVFERFYRVDKGRSRTLGGTGLGLSIVKHVMQLYKGDIQVESKTGKGTTFTVRLPD